MFAKKSIQQLISLVEHTVDCSSLNLFFSTVCLFLRSLEPFYISNNLLYKMVQYFFTYSSNIITEKGLISI